MAEAALVVAALLVVTAAVRGSMAAAAIAAPAAVASPDDLADVTVLVAVRSGDPLLPDVLASSVRTLAPARVVLLVDDDDAAGRAAATAAAGQAMTTADHAHVEVAVCPPPAPGVNPKVHKLALADVRTGTVVLLDDDTALPAGGLARLVGALADADLATGVPVYREQGGLWSRLLAAFVNGSALVTYLPLARVGPPVSINGMVVALRRDRLEAVGGFAALATATCDDYALARLFRAHGLRIVQTAQPAIVATTVPSASAYLRIVRRWLLFAGEVVRRDLSVRLLLLVLLPTALPLVAVALAAASGRLAVVAALVVALAASALVTRALRRRVTAPPPPDATSLVHATIPAVPPARTRPALDDPTGAAAREAKAADRTHDAAASPTSSARTVGAGWLGVLLEPVAAVLAPVQAAAAQVGPRTVTWRGRSVRVGIGSAP
ncbi:glycosyltransferase [Cellulomonas fimi]|uniref:glycosyltransferase family 21 protein n=1 Tax=Cellulomonas fimi TaxID=1708 RepID=UPI00234DCB90|nr:glycosyltransferase [Cellulomonas fimi]MDC7122467.1 glycosyltransferase [Cellulomonas fimi]